MTFQPPVEDIALALKAAGLERLATAWPDADADTVQAILEAAGAFSAEVIAPLNRVGDLKGATYANGRVTAAPGFADAYRQFAAGGWNSLSAWFGAAEGSLPPSPGQRRMDRHHEPDRAAIGL